MTSPEFLTETTLGTMPERIRGPVSSITATRLLVVPRSMPTIFEDFGLPKSISDGFASAKSICSVDIEVSSWGQTLVNIAQQVGDVAAAIERAADFLQRNRVRPCIVAYA